MSESEPEKEFLLRDNISDSHVNTEMKANALSESRSTGIPLYAFVLFVIVVDQLTKWIVLKNMYKHQSIDLLGDWLKFTFTENPGMAFGIEYGYPGLISVVSIAATVMILVYAYKVSRFYRPYSISLGFVLGGALGNIIDRVFYGMILYGEPVLQGKVVDFIHVNVWRGTVSEGIPFLGGKFLALFPIWNVADMAIVLGVVGILFFQKRFHDRVDELNNDPDESAINRSNTNDSSASKADKQAEVITTSPLQQE